MTRACLLATLLVAACSAPCPPAAAGASSAANATTPPSSDRVGQAEALADEVCACPSAMCADDGAARFTEVIRERGELDREATARLLAASEKLIGCRVRLAYPSEPVDMDGAGEASDGG